MSYKWVKIAGDPGELDFSAGGIAEVQAGGKTICITRFNNTLHACAAKCPHAGGDMRQGFLDANGHIVCPVHRYKFDTANGRNVSGEGYFLTTYPIEIKSDGIYVGIKRKFW